MAPTTVASSRVISPNAGVIELEVEVTVDLSSSTLDVTTLDGGQGIVTLLSCDAYDANLAQVASPTTSFTGTVITFNSGKSAVKTLVIRGR